MLSKRPRLSRYLPLALGALIFGFDASSAFGQAGRFCMSWFRFNRAPYLEVEGSTSRNQTCMINYGARSEIVGYRLLIKPQHGILGAAGHGGGKYLTAYRPNSGFAGSDSFELQIDYIPFQGPRVRERIKLRVNMTVSP